MKILTLFFLLWAFIRADAQYVDANVVLKTALQEDKFRLNQSLAQRAASLNYRLPLIQKTELRIGADDNVNDQKQLGIGFSFNTYQEIQRQYAWHRAKVTSIQAQDTWLLQDALEERYKVLLDIYLAEQLSVYYQTLDTLLERENVLLRAAVERGVMLKAKDIFDNESDRNMVAQNLMDIEKSKQAAYKLISVWLQQDVQKIDFQSFIHVQQIPTLLVGLDTTIVHPEVLARTGQWTLLEASRRLEKAQFYKIVNGVQLGMEEQLRNNKWQTSPFVRLTLNIPLINNRRRDWNDYDLRQRELENRMIVVQNTTQRNFKKQLNLIQNLLKEYDYLYKLQKNNLTEMVLNQPKFAAEMDALEIIRLRVLQQKTILMRVRVAEELLKTYLNTLLLGGQISKFPLKNYLSSDLRAF